MRPYRPTDLDALYAISLATGDLGQDASSIYADARMMGHLYSAPYANLAPDFAFVLEDDVGVAGFVVGTLDTSAWEAALEKQWWPRLRTLYPEVAVPPDRSATPDERRIAAIHRPEHAPSAVVDRFPAHLHLNLLPRCQGQGFGRAMFDRWMSARGSGGGGVHVATNRQNVRAVTFWAKLGFADVTPPERLRARTVWMGSP